MDNILKNKHMKANEIVKRYVTAVDTNVWDYPKGYPFQSKNEIYTLVTEGKTIYDFAREGSIHFGTITGSIMAFGMRTDKVGFGHVSQSTKKALRKAIDYAITKTTIQ
jgi:hypothetical protein